MILHLIEQLEAFTPVIYSWRDDLIKNITALVTIVIQIADEIHIAHTHIHIYYQSKCYKMQGSGKSLCQNFHFGICVVIFLNIVMVINVKNEIILSTGVLVICCLDCIMSLVSISEILSIYLEFKPAELSLT